MSENQGKCPVMHGAATTNNSADSTSVRDWWPNNLNLNILHQHDNKSDVVSHQALVGQCDAGRSLARTESACPSAHDISESLSAHDPPTAHGGRRRKRRCNLCAGRRSIPDARHARHIRTPYEQRGNSAWVGAQI